MHAGLYKTSIARYIIIHVGTNDLASSKKSNEIAEYINERINEDPVFSDGIGSIATSCFRFTAFKAGLVRNTS